MKNTYYILLLTVLPIITGCKDKGDDHTIGNPNDNIGLSVTKLTFESGGGMQEAHTEGQWWYISGIIDLTGGRDEIEIGPDYEVTDTVYTYKWLSVQRIGLQTLRIYAAPNDSPEVKSAIIELDSGNYNGRLDIVQKAAGTE